MKEYRLIILFVLLFGCGSYNPVTVSAVEQSSSGLWTATVSWDRVTQNSDGTPISDLSGYKIYYGTSSGNYDDVLDVGNVTSFIINQLEDMRTYFFAVTAYDFSANESGFSSEVSTRFEPVPAEHLPPLAKIYFHNFPKGDTLVITSLKTMVHIVVEIDSLFSDGEQMPKGMVDAIDLHLSRFDGHDRVFTEKAVRDSMSKFVLSGNVVSGVLENNELYYFNAQLNIKQFEGGWPWPPAFIKIAIPDNVDVSGIEIVIFMVTVPESVKE